MSIRLVLDSRAIPMVTPSIPLLTHHPHHCRPQVRPHPVPPLTWRTRCSPSLTALMHSRTRPRSTEFSLPRIWRPFALTCIQFLPTRTPFSIISIPSRTSLLSYSTSTNHHRHRRSDTIDHQGSFLHPLLFFYSQWGHWSHLFGGVWVVIRFLFGWHIL